MPSNCQYCGGAVTAPKWRRQKYCSPACYHKKPQSEKQRNALQAGRRLGIAVASVVRMRPNKVCSVCGVAFHPNTNQQVFCSKTCSNRRPHTEAQKASFKIGRKLGIASAINGKFWESGHAAHRTPEMRERWRKIAISLRKRGSVETSIERKMKNLLIAEGIAFEQEREIESVGCVDFFLPACGVVVECDGAYWHNQPGVREKDALRDAKLAAMGYSVQRFTDAEINKKLPSVRARIIESTQRAASHAA